MIVTAERAVMLMERDDSGRHNMETEPLTPLSDASTASYEKYGFPDRDGNLFPSGRADAEAASSSGTNRLRTRFLDAIRSPSSSGSSPGDKSKVERVKDKMEEKRAEGEKKLEMEEEKVERREQDRRDEKQRASRRTEGEGDAKDDI